MMTTAIQTLNFRDVPVGSEFVLVEGNQASPVPYVKTGENSFRIDPFNFEGTITDDDVMVYLWTPEIAAQFLIAE
jgi:hypothetical protein